MFKYLLIFFVFWCKSRARECSIADTSSTRIDSSEDPPCPPTTSLFSNLEEPIKKPLTMNGYNYYVGQQIINVYDSQFFRRLLSNKNDSSTSGNTDTHKFYSHKLTWNDAREACVHQGGHLAIINSEYEERNLSRLLEENNMDKAWLGIHDLFKEGNWVTVLDQSLVDTGYYKWKRSTYNNSDWNCGVLIKNEGIVDGTCNVQRSFICEFSTQNC